MDLAPQLASTLLCLLACSGIFVQGCNTTIGEVVGSLDTLSKEETPCTQLTVAHIFAVSRNTTKNEILCRARVVFRQLYSSHKVTHCLTNRREHDILHKLKGLYRTFRYLAPLTNCPVKDSTQRTLKSFLENLKTIMQDKYSHCGS